MTFPRIHIRKLSGAVMAALIATLPAALGQTYTPGYSPTYQPQSQYSPAPTYNQTPTYQTPSYNQPTYSQSAPPSYGSRAPGHWPSRQHNCGRVRSPMPSPTPPASISSTCRTG